jgi:hypothetical protein
MAPGTIISSGIHVLAVDVDELAVCAVIRPEAMAVIAEI